DNSGGRCILINKLLEFFQSKDKNGNPTKLPRKYGYFIVIGLIGLLFLLLGNIFTGAKDEDENLNNNVTIQNEEKSQQVSSKDSSITSDVNELEENYKNELEDRLETIKCDSEVEVMINLD